MQQEMLSVGLLILLLLALPGGAESAGTIQAADATIAGQAVVSGQFLGAAVDNRTTPCGPIDSAAVGKDDFPLGIDEQHSIGSVVEACF
ncbi:MAG: hypothetical protein V4510_03645 [bacterium]